MDSVPFTPSLLRLTESAAGQVSHLLRHEPENAGKQLRIFVEGGGCSGMKYGLVFDEPRPEDHICESQGVRVLVDAVSAEYLNGAVVDYTDDLNDSGFKIQNPNARNSCGCGKSFET